MKSNLAERLSEIAEEIEGLTREAYDIVRSTDLHEAERAKGYWYAHILSALGSASYRSTSLTLQDTISALEEVGAGDEDDLVLALDIENLMEDGVLSVSEASELLQMLEDGVSVEKVKRKLRTFSSMSVDKILSRLS